MSAASDPIRKRNREPRGVVLRRRLVTIPRAVVLFVLLTLLFPLLVVGAGAVDAARWITRRRPAMALRLVAFAWVFLAVELVGLARFGWHWLVTGFGRDEQRLVDKAWKVQAWWARTLLGAVLRLFSLRMEVTGLEDIGPGPILALFRHASIIDNLLPAVLLTDRLGFELRWVIKRELLTEAALDVGGNRLPNYFVDREADDPRAEVRQIRELARGLGPGEGVLIFPEGTRFSQKRRQRALESLRKSGSRMHERAARLRHLMPPRPGGVTTLLDEGMTIVVCGHVGLGGFAKISDLWSGSLVGRTIVVRFWVIDPETVPQGRAARADWLYDVWQEMDDWIERVQAQPPS